MALETGIDACGTVHLVYEGRNMSTLVAGLEYATTRSRWSAIEQPFPSFRVNLLDLHRAADGRLIVVFTGGRRGAPVDSPLRTYVAEKVLDQAP